MSMVINAIYIGQPVIISKGESLCLSKGSNLRFRRSNGNTLDQDYLCNIRCS